MSKRTYDAETIKIFEKWGKENPHLAHLGATKGRLIHTNIQTLIKQARAKQAKEKRLTHLEELKALEEELQELLVYANPKEQLKLCKEDIDVLRKRYYRANKESLETGKEAFKNFYKTAYRAHLSRMVRVVAKAYIKLLPMLKKAFEKETESEVMWKFIKRQAMHRSHDEQIMRFTKETGEDVAIKLGIIAGAKKGREEE